MKIIYICKELQSNDIKHFSAQLWRINAKGQLENKLRRWYHSDSIIKLDPKDDNEGHIEIVDIDKVLSPINEITKEVGYEEKNSLSSDQIWNLSQEQENGWRNIVHNKSGLYLTLRKRSKGSTVLKLENKGMK